MQMAPAQITWFWLLFFTCEVLQVKLGWLAQVGCGMQQSLVVQTVASHMIDDGFNFNTVPLLHVNEGLSEQSVAF
jgi:hypothetical protein